MNNFERIKPIGMLQMHLEMMRQAANKHPYPLLEERKRHLQTLKRVLQDNEEALLEAIHQDFSSRSKDEMRIAEIAGVLQGIHYQCRHLKKWMKAQRRHLPWHFLPGKAQVHFQPLGVVGVMVPFNYPIFLSCSPLIAALAAGNRVMIKMPEATPQCSALFAELIEEAFDESVVTVINGDAKVSAEFSRLRFDHLIFTGSTAVGKKVMAAAAENLTPVTLELGGKSPVIIDDEADIEEAARRICFGKSFNGGQTCVAPDYVLVPRDKQADFIAAYRRQFTRLYPVVNGSADYTALISWQQFTRISNLLDDAKNKGAEWHAISEEKILDGSRKLLPVLLSHVNDKMAVMQEEIFGPILPLVPYDQFHQAVAYINKRARPLALYYFGFNRERQQALLHTTHSGGVVFNEVMFHVAVDDLPFGGIGDSGIGQYHGREGFLTLSKAKPVLHKGRFNSFALLYPPYGGRLSILIMQWLKR